MKEYGQIIDAFLTEEMSFEDFYSKFNDLYAHDSTSQLPEKEFQFVDDINEKLFFVGKDPSQEEQEKYKYMDDSQFRDWLEQKKSESASLWT